MSAERRKTRIANDAAAGAVGLVIGLGATLHSLQLGVGSTSYMGPGYFPFLIGLFLIVLGVMSILSGRKPGASALDIPMPIRLPLVLLGLVAFAFLLRPAGLFIAATVLSLFAGFAMSRLDLKYFIFSLFLAAASVMIFVYGLGLSIKPFP